jgi:hypothetical protein
MIRGIVDTRHSSRCSCCSAGELTAVLRIDAAYGTYYICLDCADRVREEAARIRAVSASEPV